MASTTMTYSTISESAAAELIAERALRPHVSAMMGGTFYYPPGEARTGSPHWLVGWFAPSGYDNRPGHWEARADLISPEKEG